MKGIQAHTDQVIPREPGCGKKYRMRDAPQREEGAARHRRPHHRRKTRTQLAWEHKNSTRYAYMRPSASNARHGKGTRATNPRVPSSPEVWPCTHLQAAAGTTTKGCHRGKRLKYNTTHMPANTITPARTRPPPYIPHTLSRPPTPRRETWYEGGTHTGAHSAATKHTHNEPEHKEKKRMPGAHTRTKTWNTRCG